MRPLVPAHLLAAVLSLAAAAPLAAVAQAPHPLTPQDQQRITDIIGKMTLAEKLDYIGGTGFAVRAMPALHLPALEMSDGPVGTRSNAGLPSTTYAGGIGLAASWDTDLAREIGAGIGRDARARGVHFMLGPGVNIYRSPRNGRNFEYFGEDPFLTSRIAVGYITGMQSTGVSSTIKHYIANNSEYLRHDSDSIVEPRAMHELYLPSFEAAIKDANVGAVMDSYNLIDGKHATENPHINIDFLRKDFGFTGTLMSDWDATYNGVAAANGGLDLEMPTGKFMNRKNLEPAIAAGTVTQATIDEKIRHILTTAMEFGWLDRPQQDDSLSIASTENNRIALRSAQESIVLLKNDKNLLPLSKSQIKSILVVGPDSYPGVPDGGGSAAVTPFHTVSALEGITTELAGTNATVFYDRGLPTIADLARSTTYTTPDGKPGLLLEEFGSDTPTGTATASSTVQHVFTNGISIQTIVDDPEVMQQLLSGGDLMGGTRKTSRRWSGTWTAPGAGDYIFAIEGSGEGSGNRASIDGKQIFDNWDLVRAYQPSVTLHLSAGSHKLVVEDKQAGIFSGRIRFGIAPASTIVSDRAKALASKADVVLVSAGFDHSSESEGGDRTFSLPLGQDQLIAAMAAANPHTIVAVTAGGNVDSQPWLNQVPVWLQTWYGGQAGGTALAQTLFGDINPSGHLPITLERRAEDNPTFNNYYPDPGTNVVHYKEGIFVGYRGYEHNHTKPLYPFGYGLSYSTFSFSKLHVISDNGANPHATVTFDVTNSGVVKGATVAQLYLSDDHLKAPHADRQLKGFERVELAPGETRHVSLTLNPRAFAWWNPDTKAWTIDPGKFTIHVGDSVATTPLQTDLTLTKEAATTTF